GSPLDRVELYVKAPGHTDFSKTATDASPATTGGHFDYTATAGDGDYAFYTVAYDKARNVEAPPGAPDATTTLDTAAPTSSASGATAIDASSIQVDYTADGTGSALDKVQLYVQAPGETGFSKVATDSSPAATGGHFDYRRQPATATTPSTRSPTTRRATWKRHLARPMRRRRSRRSS